MNEAAHHFFEAKRAPVAVPVSGVYRELSPRAKVGFAALYLVLTVSFGRYDWLGSSLFALFPYLAAAVGGVFCKRMLKRALAALPFVICAGAANCWFDRVPVEVWTGLNVPGGVVSFAVLIAKTLGSVGMALLLTGTTPLAELAEALTAWGVPCILAIQIQLLCRYIGLAAAELGALRTAYLLRSSSGRLPVRDWGMLVGRLFLRMVARGDTLYNAMQCRLFSARRPLAAGRRAAPLELVLWIGAAVLLVLARCCL